MKTSLNHSYRLVWSDVQQTFVPVPECASGRGKSSGGKASRITRSLLASLALTAGVVHAQAVLPAGGQIVGGSGNITTQGKSMTVTQTSDRMAADWQSFSIGKDHSVNFVQPSSSSVALNRVLGSDVSVIQGAINANGQVFLVNPNGVLFTKDAQVNVGAMVASTLNISTADFMAGNYKFEGASSNAIVNQGRMTAVGNGEGGGTVALIAAKITNEGSIQAHAGNVLMGAGSKVTLDLGGPVKIQVEQGALDALITQGGAIKADGGLVYLSAKAAGDLVSTVINHTGITEAQTLATGEAGQIYLMGGMQKDRIEVGGKLDASAPNGGNGGFIETSAAKVDIRSDLKVSTKAEDGRTGEWLIDPFDFTVASSGGNITGAALGALLADNHITIQTANPEPSSSSANLVGSAGTNGDIFVNDRITWTSGKTLTLNAWRNIEINAPIDASGGSGGKLALMYGQGSDDGMFSGVSATYTINAPVRLKDGANFSTQLGSDLPAINYTVVNSQEALQAMALNGNYALGSSLTFSGNWTAIGSGRNNCDTMFCGNFDGLGNTIRNMNITPTGPAAGDGIGFFAAMENAAVRNLTFDQATVNTDSVASFSGAVGTLVGWQVNSLVHNVHVTNSTVTANNASAAGGLVGWLGYDSSAVVSQSSVHLNVYGSNYVGGLVGNFDGGLISKSYASGSVNASRENSNYYVGGLVGASNASIRDSYSTATASGAGLPINGYVGGLVGDSTNRGNIENTYATGVVTGGTTRGGLIGNRDGGTVTNSFWDVDSTGQTTSAGGMGIRSSTANVNAYTQATYTGFDFTNNWWMVDGATRPFLRSEWRPSITNAHELQLMAMKLDASYTLANNLNLAPSLAKQSEMWKGTLVDSNFQGSWTPIGKLRPSYNEQTVNRDDDGNVIGTQSRWRPTGSDTPFVGTFDGKNYSITGLAINLPVNYPENPVANQVFDSSGVGLFGFVSGATSSIRNLTLINPVVSGNYAVGSIIGMLWNGSASNLTVQNAQVTGSNSVGGVVGRMRNASAQQLQSGSGTITGTGDVGGLLGYIDYSTITGGTAAVTVSGKGGVGGLVGSASDGTVSDSSATGSVTNTGTSDGTGGLLGTANRLTTITNSHATGKVSAPNANFTGGLVGTITGGTVRLSYSEGDVEGKSAVGGLVGFARLFSGTTNILIERSYATGKVTATGDNAGGLLGAMQMGSSGGTDIFDSFALGDVSGTNHVGGLVGSYAEYSYINSKIRRSFSAGQVTGTGSNLGGLVGSISGGGNTSVAVIDSYWDKTTSGRATSAGGVGKTTAEMQDIALYSGWDVADDQNLTDAYPRLSMSTVSGEKVWKIKSVTYSPSSSDGSSSNTGSGDGSTGGSDSSGGSSSGAGSSSNTGSGSGSTGGSGSSGSSSSGGSSSNTGTGGGSTDSSSTGGSGTGNNGNTTDQTAGNGGGNNSGTGSSTVPPSQPTNTAEEQQRQTAIQAAQLAAQVAARQVSAASAGASGVAGNSGISSSTSSQLGAGPSGSLASPSLSGGLAFVNVSQSQGGPETSTESSVQAPARSVQVSQDGAGRDVSGFMRVFVVNGGISLPPQIHDADHR